MILRLALKSDLIDKLRVVPSDSCRAAPAFPLDRTLGSCQRPWRASSRCLRRYQLGVLHRSLATEIDTQQIDFYRLGYASAGIAIGQVRERPYLDVARFLRGPAI